MQFNLSSSNFESSSRVGRDLSGAEAAVFPVVIDRESLLLLAAVGVFIFTRLWHLTAAPLSYDEIFSIDAVQHDWPGLFTFIRQDMVHPPLFYVLLKLWRSVGGDSTAWLRLFPAAVAIISIFPLLKSYGELNIRNAQASLALLLATANGFLLYYSQLLRMYSLLLFLSICSLWFFVRLLKESKDRWPVWALFAANLLLVYTHYFGWVLIAAELVVLIILCRARLLAFIVTTILTAISFSPWVYAVSQAYLQRGMQKNFGWIVRPHLADVTSFITTLNDRPFDIHFNGIAGILLFGSPIALWGWRVWRKKHQSGETQSNTFWLLFLLSFLPIALVFGISLLLRQPVWLPRGLIFVAVPYFTLVAVAVLRLQSRWLRAAVLVLVVGWSVVAGIRNSTQLAHEADVRNWIRYMAQVENGKSNDVEVYSLDPHLPYLMRFYLGSADRDRFHINLVQEPTSELPDYWLNQALFRTVTVNELTELKGTHFWFGYRKSQWDEKRSPQQIFSAAGFRVGESFKGEGKNKELYLFPVWR